MKTKSASLKPSKRTSKRSENETTPLGRSIVRGLEQAVGHARGELKLRTRLIYVEDSVVVRRVREKTGLSQSQFAKRYGFPLRSLQDWEQGRYQLESSVRSYLRVIEQRPKMVAEALRKAG